MARKRQTESTTKTGKGSKPSVKRESGRLLDMSNVRIPYPANNLPTSVSDEAIETVIRNFNASHFRKSAR